MAFREVMRRKCRKGGADENCKINPERAGKYIGKSVA